MYSQARALPARPATSRFSERQAGAVPTATRHISERVEYYTIGEMARTYSISLRALRFYEDRGLIKPQRHGATRLYDGRQRVRVQLILKGKQLGFTLTEIREMLASHGDEPPAEFEQTLDEKQIAAQIDMLERQRDGIDRAIIQLRASAERLNGGERLTGAVL